MKHFIDLGTHKFEGLEMFTKKLGINTEWNVYCFEPDPNTYQEASKLLPEIIGKYNNLTFKNKAVSNKEGNATFYRSVNTRRDGVKVPWDPSVGSSLHQLESFKNKRNQSMERQFIPTEIQLEDITKTINSIVESDKDAEIYIKCDTEGEEYNIIPAILNHSEYKRVKHLYVEWHDRLWSDRNNHAEIVALTKELEQQIISTEVVYSSHI